MHDSVKKLKIQLIGAALTVVVSAVALSATTYAWFVTNSRVHATTSTISAQANGMVSKSLRVTHPTTAPTPLRLLLQPVTRLARHRRTMPKTGTFPKAGRALM